MRLSIAVELQEGFSGAPQVELRRVNALIRIGRGRRRARGIGIRALGIASSRFSARGIRAMIEDIPIVRLLVASMCPVPVISAVEGVERRSRTRIRSFSDAAGMKKVAVSVSSPTAGSAAPRFTAHVRTRIDFEVNLG